MDSYIQKGVVLKGAVQFQGVVLIEGEVEGTIYASDHLIVGESGRVRGDIEAGHLTNRGTIEGNIRAGNKVSLMKDSHLKGDITAFQLVIEEGSSFDGRCTMLDAPQYKEKVETTFSSAEPAKKSAHAMDTPSPESSASGLDGWVRQFFSK